MTKATRHVAANLMAGVVDRLPVGIRIVSLTGAIQYENTYMRQLADDAAYTRPLRDAMARVCSELLEHGIESSRRVLLDQQERSGWVTIEAFPLHATARTDRPSGVAIVATRCAGARERRRPQSTSDVRKDFALSAREVEVAQIIASGASNALVAEQLGISIHTAKRHAERVLAKLGVSSRSAAAAMLSRLAADGDG